MGGRDGRVVLITGTGSGIGHALARRFRADGDSVAGCDLPESLARAEEVCDPAYACDVTDADALAHVVAQVEERLGRVDALVANAGIGLARRLEAATPSELEAVIRVNLLGVLYSIQAVLPGMRRRGHGRIIAVASRAAEFGPPNLLAYSASKAGVVAATRALARDLAGSDILVNNLIPGPSRTGMNPRGPGEPDACYPTVRMLATLPSGGPSGRTFWNERDYAIFSRFSDPEEPRPLEALR